MRNCQTYPWSSLSVCFPLQVNAWPNQREARWESTRSPTSTKRSTSSPAKEWSWCPSEPRVSGGSLCEYQRGDHRHLTSQEACLHLSVTVWFQLGPKANLNIYKRFHKIKKIHIVISFSNIMSRYLKKTVITFLKNIQQLTKHLDSKTQKDQKC